VTTLELKCLGGLVFLQNELPILDLKSTKGQALLCYLAVSGKRFTRSALAGIFWGDMPESQALMNLRKVLNRMKPLSDYLLIARETLAINPHSSYWLDVREFNAAAAQSDIQSLQYAASLYQGDFLDGFDVDDIPLFTDWVRSQRARLREAAVDCLQTLIHHFTDINDYHAAIHFTRQLLTIETWNEEAHLELMRLLNLSGQHSEAIKQYEMCCRILKKELGVEPASATIHLYQQIIAERLVG
jgi:DNA-binding SARP family transcriptional activator